MRRFALCIVLGFLLTGCGAAKQDADWQTVTPDDHSFTLRMPGAPKVQQVTQPTATGSAILHEYVYKNPPVAVYMLSYQDAPADIPNTDAYLDQTVEQTAVALEAKVTQTRSATVKGFPGRDFELLHKNGRFEFARLCLVKNRLYTLRAAYIRAAKKKNVTDRAQLFLNSFEPTPR